MTQRRCYCKSGEAARRAGIHPNTLRWYETAGYLPPVPRTPGGYRLYTPQLCQLAWIVHASQPMLRIYGPIRSKARAFLNACRDNSVETAHQALEALHAHVERERALANRALATIARWSEGVAPPGRHATARPGQSTAAQRHGASALPGGPANAATPRMLHISAAAQQTGVTRDQIISWERNGLLVSPRAPHSGYRLFGRPELERLLVIRFCRTAGYSVTAIRRLMAAVDATPSGWTAGNVPGRQAARPSGAACASEAPGRAPAPGAHLVALRTLKRVANTPDTAEVATFPVFPTDTLPRTLDSFVALCNQLEARLPELA